MSALSLAKKTAALLPLRAQQELKRVWYQRQIARQTFRLAEPEWELASHWLSPGDWAIDVGANIGHYTKRFSDLVGPRGRVFAFEPVPATFELLAANVMRFSHSNVTLLNLAASESTQELGIVVPVFDTGLPNYYGAELSPESNGLRVLTCAIDSLALSRPVRVLKVDAEGHDDLVLFGARALIERDRPTIVIEFISGESETFLQSLGYSSEAPSGSPNRVYRRSNEA